MRVISGKFKGRKLELPDPKVTRPLRDYVKESLFNLLSHSKLLNFKFENSIVLDVFSGSGSFGIECLSRGSQKINFFEKNKETINILNQNINKSLNNNFEIFLGDFLDINLEKILINKIDLIFLDPPFDYKFLDKIFLKLKNYKKFLDNTLILVHYENKNIFNFEKYLKINLKKKYGRSEVIFGTMN